jgi:hypothetical protein
MQADCFVRVLMSKTQTFKDWVARFLEGVGVYFEPK